MTSVHVAEIVLFSALTAFTVTVVISATFFVVSTPLVEMVATLAGQLSE